MSHATSNGETVVKTKFVAHSVDPKEPDVYWMVTCGQVVPPTDSWSPPKPGNDRVAGCPSYSHPSYLEVIRHFCRVPDAVEFRLPRAGERADSPPDGYFTCNEAHLLCCRFWFPIPEVIVQVLNRYELSISQLMLTGLQHLVGIVVLSYEWGMILNDDCLEALLAPVAVPKSRMCRLAPRPRMGIIKGFASNTHSFWEHFFFVRIDSASVEESCILFFRSQWGRKETNIHPPFPEDILTVRNIVRGGTYFWGHFSPERVRRAVAYNRSQLQPDLPVEGESETDIEEFVPYDILVGVVLIRLIRRDPTTSPLISTAFFDFGMPSNVGDSVELKAYRMCNGGLHLVTETLKACTALFKAEVLEKELARLKEEAAANSTRTNSDCRTSSTRSASYNSK
ncbi:hypothetical protein F2Q68_00030996 [Brassica cretica]|uniref:Uncharacterized protein n=1 Tax=Brassica cretica TaxID=69181 RepID=A0A8S9G4U3_BRACR|nr:hypothetical protein F2Q68_00030996 [Brassica cretica]